MSFVDPEFPLFFAVVLALYALLPHRAQNVLLLVASAVFYGWVHPWFLTLLLASAGLDYLAALGMRRFPPWKRALLGLSIAGNGLLLGFFKYLDWFVGNVGQALEALGLGVGPPVLGLVVPVGISFYTFQTLAYAIDVYRGRVEPRRSFVDYLLFVMFFPQLVAGPIERAANLLPQIERPRSLGWERLWSGLQLAVWGGFKKVVIADTLAIHVNAVFRDPDPSFAMIWAGALGFLFQILADFTGYADIARGTARILGFELTDNFDHPLLATSPSDLWQRWHITLMKWLQDYVYFPIATSRWARRVPIPFLDGGMRTAVVAIAGTLLFSGLWHGAAWHFVLWGVYWAVVQIGWMLVARRVPARWRGWRHASLVLVPVMFALQWVGAMLFREPSVARLAHHFTANPFAGTREEWAVAAMLVALVAVMSLPLGAAYLLERAEVAGRWRLPLESTALAGMGWAILVFARPTTTDFVYFQF